MIVMHWWIILSLVILGSYISTSQPWSKLWPTPTSTPLPTSQVVASPQPKQLQACDLIETSALSQLMGDVMSEPEQSAVVIREQFSQQTCLWLAADGSYAPSITLSITTFPDNGPLVATDSAGSHPWDNYWSAMQQKHQTKPRYQAITGLGDQAFWSSTEIFVLQDASVLTILVSLPEPEKNQAAALSLAEQASSRLSSKH